MHAKFIAQQNQISRMKYFSHIAKDVGYSKYTVWLCAHTQHCLKLGGRV